MIFLKHSLIGSFCKRRQVLFIIRRFKKTSKLKLFDPREKALTHFDDFYKAVFTQRWPSIRLGLLSKEKYMAVLNNFCETEKTEKFLIEEGAFDFFNFIKVQKDQSHNADQKVRSNKNSSKKVRSNVKLEEIIKEQAIEKDCKAVRELHPDGVDFLSRTAVLNDDNGKINEREVVYKPQNANNSLHSDLLTSQIDKSRLIEPEEGMAQISLQEYMPATHLRGLEDYIPESEYYKYYQMENENQITVEKEFDLEIPEKLKVFTFDRGDVTQFPHPTRNIYNVYNYLRVEGSNILTALALGVQPDDKVLDLNSISGEMAYCIFQTLRPKILICTTRKKSKTEYVFQNSLYNYSPCWNEMLLITQKKFEDYENKEMFDRVLVDVPSTQDRVSVMEIEDNIFHVSRIRERLKLPQFQSELLEKGLRLVSPGGTVLYSTSSLSPIQNEAVVSGALRSVWESDKMEFIIKDLGPALQPFSSFFNFGDFLDMKYGTLIVPFAPINFGPKYFCKLVKKKKF